MPLFLVHNVNSSCVRTLSLSLMLILTVLMWWSSTTHGGTQARNGNLADDVSMDGIGSITHRWNDDWTLQCKSRILLVGMETCGMFSGDLSHTRNAHTYASILTKPWSQFVLVHWKRVKLFPCHTPRVRRWPWTCRLPVWRSSVCVGNGQQHTTVKNRYASYLACENYN